MTTTWKRAAPVLALIVVFTSLAASPSASARAVAAAPTRTGMTWSVVAQNGGYVHIGSDGQTNPYAGDTTIDQFRAILCLRVDGRAAPGGMVFDLYNGWARGEVKATPAIAGTVLTSPEQGDQICDETFGTGFEMAEFHDGRHGADFSLPGGWSFWAAGSLPLGTRLWVSINDQPANPWNSAGEIPTVSIPKYLPSSTPVPGQYLALLPEGTAEGSVATIASDLLATYGGAIIDVFPAAGGFSFTGSDAGAQAMSGDARVESVEQDSYGTETWHLDRVDQRNRPLDGIYSPPNNGSGVNIYVLDTGFRRSHAEFGGRATQAMDFIRFVGQRDDCNGHGTGVGSVAGGATTGVAPGANLISIRIAGCRGNAYNPLISVTSSTIVAGLDWVARFHVKPAVANVSYGVAPGFWRRWFKTRTPMDRAVKRAVQAGVTVTASAGNEGRNADRSSPARAGEAISVSATDISDQKPSWANYGKVEIFAPGVSLRVADLSSDTSFAIRSGTSLAAPMVAGAAAIYLHDHPAASPAQVRAALLGNATTGVVGNPGPGSPNRLLYVRFNARNLALGAAASASSTFPNYSVTRINDGSRDTRLGGLHSWANDAGTYPPLSPEWVQLDFGTARTFSSAVVFTSQGYPIRDFDIQVFTGSGWVTPAGGRVRGNTALAITIPFTVQTSRYVRVLAFSGPTLQPGYVRVNELGIYP